MVWREDNRRVANGTQWKWIISAALAAPKSGSRPRGQSVDDRLRLDTTSGPLYPNLPRGGAGLCISSPRIRIGARPGAEKRIARLQTELVHLDAVLRMFRPEFKTEGLRVRHRRPTKSPYFTHGELTQRIFDAMRVNGTVTSFEVAAQAMRDKGLDPENDKLTRTDFVRRLSLALGDMCRKGKIERVGRGKPLRWKFR
jgi:hypothetical protein